jgi:ubiquinone/menaquinone biosynthesis C-methylase UbiE
MAIYPARSYSFAHGNALEALARLHGLTPVPMKNATVLEIGCASGGQLIPMAARMPTTKFVGIDLDFNEISLAKDWAARHQLSNIEFYCCPVEEWDESQPFDYIICHGLLSWIPSEIRPSVLNTVDRLLSENGVALLSHAIPAGSSAKLIVQELFRTASSVNEPEEIRVEKGRSALKELVLSFGSESNSFIVGIKEQYELLKDAPWGFLAQDIIAENFEPISLLDLSKETKLNYVCDALLSADKPRGLSAALQEIGNSFDDIVQRCHFWDLCKGRSFRRGVWAKKKSNALDWMYVKECYVRVPIKIQPGWNLDDGDPGVFVVSSGREVGVRTATSKGMVTVLAARPEVQIKMIIEQFGEEGIKLLQQLAELEAVTILSEKQVVFELDPYISKELQHTRYLSDAFLQMVTISHFERSLILSLQDEARLYEKLIKDAQQGKYELHVEGELCIDESNLKSILPQIVPKRIQKLLWQGIVGQSLSDKFL